MSRFAAAPDATKAAGRRIVASWGQLTARNRMLPDFLICGAQRCGTTSLARALARHPDVIAPLFHKGVHYFDTATHYARGLDWYRGHFPVRAVADRRSRRGRAVTGEASPYYVFHPLAPERIARDVPTARLVVLLRDPVERAFSAHKQETARGFETESLDRALALEDERLAGEVERIVADPTYQSFHHQHHAYARRGQYADQLESLCAATGPEQVLALETDSLLSADRTDWARLLDHLGLPSWDPGPLPRANARPSAPLPPALRRRLVDRFEVADARLAALLGRELSWRR